MRTEQTNLQATRVANIFLSAAGALCIIIVLYAARHYYGWTEQGNLIGAARLLIYFVFPGVLAPFFFAALRLDPRQKVGVCLLLFSTTVSIYTLELFLSLTDSTAPPAEWFAHKSIEEKQQIAKKFGVDFDTRSKLEFIMDLRKEGIDAKPYASASILLQPQPDGSVRSAIAIDGSEVLPLGGISNTVTVLCNETGDHVVYKSDEYGFNNPKGIWDADVKIAVIGDSFTHGSCVPNEQNFVALIREHYPTTLNLGGGGQGPLLMLAAIKEYVQHVRPPFVLWSYFEGNDLENLKNERANRILLRYLKSGFSQNLRARQSDIDRALTAYIEMAREQLTVEENKRSGIFVKLSRLRNNFFAIVTLSHLRGRLGAIHQQYSVSSSSETRDQPDMDLFRSILLDAKTLVEGWDGKLYFVYLPQWERYARPDLANSDRERVLSLVRETGIRVIDIHEVFQAQDDPLLLFPFRQNAHYNEAGNRLVAKHVLRGISLD